MFRSIQPLQFLLTLLAGWLNRRQLDAIEYLRETVLKREHDHPAVLLASTILTNAAEGKDFMMHARIAVMKALHPPIKAGRRASRPRPPAQTTRGDGN